MGEWTKQHLKLDYQMTFIERGGRERDWGQSDLGLPITRQESTIPTTPHHKGQAL